MDKKILIVAVLVVVIVVAIIGVYLLTQQAGSKPKDGTTTDGTITGENLPFYSIHDIKQTNLAPGKYSTEGYLVYLFYCPPCPEGAECIPCPGEYIIISEKNEVRDSVPASLTEDELPISAYLTDSILNSIELGEKYKFEVEIKGDVTTYHPFGDFKNIEFAGVSPA